MLSRLNDFVKRVQLGKTYRYPRMIAGKITGVFFFFSTICRIPMKNYVGGTIAVAVTSLSGLYTFITKSRENYETSDPAIVDAIERIEREHKHNSMYSILKKLESCPDHAGAFLKKYAVNTACIENVDDRNDGELEALCMLIFNAVYNGPLKNLEKYSVSIINAAEEFASNYLELMLANTFIGYVAFDPEEGFTPRNLLFTTLTLLATYHAYQTYLETKETYDKPAPTLLANSILVAFNKHRISNINDESRPLLGITDSAAQTGNDDEYKGRKYNSC